MNRKPLDTIWVCVDCYMAHNGVLEEQDPTPDCEPLGLIEEGYDLTAGMLWEEHSEDCLYRTMGGNVPGDYECDCEHITFSSSRCEGCGSTLGGAREALTLWEGK